MKKQSYFPRTVAERPEWFRNFAINLIQNAATLGLPAATVNAAVADALFCEYASGPWLTAVRELGPSGTASLETLFYDTGPGPMALSVFTPPPLPIAQPTATPPLPAVGPVAPGALNRLFALVQVIKAQATYTEAMGLQLGVVGSDDSADHPVPTFTLKTERGAGCQCVRINFQKFGRDGVAIHSRRGTGSWEMLAIDLATPYLDERPLLVATVPEVREYRLQYYVDSSPAGEMSPVQSASVAP